MTNLTEKWKKGELPSGWYYYKTLGSVCIENSTTLNRYSKRRDIKDKVEVLAEVPSYQDYEKLNWYAGNGVEENAELKERLKKTQELELELRKENTKLKTENKWYSEQLNEAVKEVGYLKELLEDCRIELDCRGDSDCQRLIAKINQVLGEE